jgi:predicted Zn-dependent peptidase
MIISIAGRIVPEEAIALLEKIFGDWQNPTKPLPNLSLPKVNSQPCQALIPQDTQQSIVMLAYLASKVQHPDYATLKLLNTYLGNGLSSRLFVELREKRGLAYDVSAFYPTRIDDSYFVVYIGTAPQNTAIAREGLKMEVYRLATIQLSEEELQAAKNKLGAICFRQTN